ncbi:MAG: SDR family oxidoreductase [Novosphingobium sp.]|nr:SDR family oxidoreductase [Novosphingobium sp.]
MGNWIVTGGAGGIGERVVSDAIEAGHAVLVWDVRKPSERDGVSFEMVDLTDPDSICAAAERAGAGLDCFVHCAGTLATATATSGNLVEAMELTFRLHCVAFVASVQALLGKFSESGGAAIAIASAGMDMVYPGTLAYGASKAALQRSIKQMAVELGGRGIRVNSVSPGAVATEMTRHLWEDPDFARERLKHVPLGRQGETKYVSDAVAFLASEAACYITGEDLWVDGGVRHGIFQPGVRAAMDDG